MPTGFPATALSRNYRKVRNMKVDKKTALAVVHAVGLYAKEEERALRAELDSALLDDYQAGITDRHLLGGFGKLYIRKGHEGVVVVNSREFEEWAYAHNLAQRLEVVEYVVADDWEEYVGVSDTGEVYELGTGEAVPGVLYQPGRITTAISGCKPDDVFSALSEHPELLTSALALEGADND